ncbi:MAG: hypothetical protein IMY84_03210 [Chloroflexi bacterium]|nr:hypothetical protein [Chloroflexota bacterium]
MQVHPSKEVLDEGKGSEEVDAEVSGAGGGGNPVPRNWLTSIHLYAIRIPDTMTLSTRKLLEDLRALEKRRRRILRRLMKTEELAVGTVSWVNRKCGRPSCHCAKGVGHRQMHFLFRDAGGRRRCKFIRNADQARLSRAGRRYAAFRAGRCELKAIEKRESEILVALKEVRGLTYE